MQLAHNYPLAHKLRDLGQILKCLKCLAITVFRIRRIAKLCVTRTTVFPVNNKLVPTNLKYLISEQIKAEQIMKSIKINLKI